MGNIEKALFIWAQTEEKRELVHYKFEPPISMEEIPFGDRQKVILGETFCPHSIISSIKIALKNDYKICYNKSPDGKRKRPLLKRTMQILESAYLLKILPRYLQRPSEDEG